MAARLESPNTRGMTTDEEQPQDQPQEQTQAQRNANLARIRDNQRRSRARRKEYLQELEVKYRTCEQVGVEASAEIQAAARRVVDENRRLRQLLKQQGLSDTEIDGIPIDVPESSQFPTAASGLESMIGQRRSCAPGSDCGSGPAGGRRFSCDPSPPAQPASAQHSLPQPPRVQPSPPLKLQPQPQPHQQQFPLPMAPPHQQYPSPMSAVSSGVPTPSNAQFATTQALSYGSSIPAHQSMDYDFHFNEPFAWDGNYQTSQPEVGNSSSCYVAAGAIRAIKPDIGYELETELGCGDGRECDVPNSQIFSIMDRYAD
ncbi:hypothetical protein LTR85_005316 [Meristemomyces frigidus]|nr:hypothetical protein LTR85_005316 [Meristemomyces frigidus]